MVYKIGDRVFAKTQIIRCSILGTIIQEHNEKVNIKFDFPIKGKYSCWVNRSDIIIKKTESRTTYKNIKIKSTAAKIINSMSEK